MLTFHAVLLKAIGPVELGMTREEVRSFLGEPCSTSEAHEKWGIRFPDKDCFIDNAFQVEYSPAGCACFIETSMHESYRVEFSSLDVHRDDASLVISSLEAVGQPNREDREYPCNQVFPSIGVSIYREHSEEDNIDAFGISTADYRAS